MGWVALAGKALKGVVDCWGVGRDSGVAVGFSSEEIVIGFGWKSSTGFMVGFAGSVSWREEVGEFVVSPRVEMNVDLGSRFALHQPIKPANKTNIVPVRRVPFRAGVGIRRARVGRSAIGGFSVWRELGSIEGVDSTTGNDSLAVVTLVGVWT